MKAKHITKLRKSLKYYEVVHSSWPFGDFYGFHSIIKPEIIIVLGKSFENAVERAHKRGYGLDYTIGNETINSTFAHWKVKELNKPDNFRYIKYF